jgi:NhaP-type Na+/H+ or K+/H+ antiporter
MEKHWENSIWYNTLIVLISLAYIAFFMYWIINITMYDRT